MPAATACLLCAPRQAGWWQAGASGGCGALKRSRRWRLLRQSVCLRPTGVWGWLAMFLRLAG